MTPRIAASAWVSEAAYVVGDVEIGERSSVWPGAVVRSDIAPIRIGENTHLEDGSVVHSGEPLTIGDHVIVAHGAIVHGRQVGNCCLIGNNATVLDGSVLGDHCLVAAGAVVLPGTEVPEASFVTGVPGVVRPAGPEHLRMVRGLATSSFLFDLASRYRDEGV